MAKLSYLQGDGYSLRSRHGPELSTTGKLS